MKNQFLFSLTFVFTLLIIRPVSSQTIEMSMVPDSNSTFEIDNMRLLISDQDQGIIAGNFNLQYKQALNSKINLIGELTYIKTDDPFAFDDNGFSNIYLGIQYKTSKSDDVDAALNTGIYLPTASQIIQLGSFTNLFDLSKYVYKSVGVALGYNRFKTFDGGLRLGFEVGSDVIIPTSDNGADVEVLGKYGGSIYYKTSIGIYLQSELLGLANITNEDGDFAESTFHTYAFGVGYTGTRLGAGLYYRNYFDDLFNENFNGILGIKFSLYL